MLKRYLILSILLIAVSFASMVPTLALASDIYGPNVKLRGDSVLVTTGLNLDEKSIEDIQKGVSKEIVFYIDLFRVWNRWPDEFVLGSTIAHTLHCDPVKKEYTAETLRGNRLTTKRFESCKQLISWTMSLPDEVLAAATVLEAEAEYYVKTTVESKLRSMPSFTKLLFFFVPEAEFQMEKSSETFKANGARGSQ